MNHFCTINCIRYILEAVTFTSSNSLSYSATVIEKRNFTTKSLALHLCYISGNVGEQEGAERVQLKSDVEE